jgi:hypothetical protein
MGRLTAVVKTTPISARESVTGKVSRNRPRTGSRERTERPKSPRTIRARYLAYCT